MLDDHLFSVDLENWETSIANESGRIKLKLLSMEHTMRSLKI